jgi:KUP system potassium uptake protein
MQLGWFPGVNIRQTSSEEYGQIYVPFVNWTMMLLTLALTIAFGSSNRLAGAYGTAVSTTMLLTTVLLYKVMRDIWRWPLPIAVLVFSVFLLVDAAFFSSNLLKIGEGGWAPLTFGALVFVVMTTWRAGIDAVHRAQRNRSVPLRDFIQRLAKYQGPHAPGVAVFLTRLGGRVPPLIVGHVEEIGAVPETMVALTVSFTGRPRVHARNRIETRRLCDGFWHVTVRYGFVEIPNLPATLHKAAELGCPLNFDTAVYFGERDEVVGRKGRPRMSRWRRLFFSFLFRNSVRAVDRFKLPPACFVEIGRQIEI